MRPIYHGRPIGSAAALAAALSIDVGVLRDFASTASGRYSRFAIAKRNGGERSICSPSHDLKIIQKRINRAIFGNVEYPNYLFGGIENRDYVKNAQQHAEAKALIALDISNFYPSITTKHVTEIFKHFCKFPPEIATILTELTTLDGSVPQGACTSSHIANLVFYDVEHRVVKEFRDRRLIYSRLLDDICISSSRALQPREVAQAISKIASLLKSKNFKLQDSKTRALSASNPETLMEVTGLWLNRGHPRAKRNDRIDIRTEVRRCESRFLISRTAPDYHKERERVSGRVAKLSYLNHFEAKRYRQRLSNILPHYDITETIKTRRLVETLARTTPGDRNTFSFVDRYHKAIHRVGILARSNHSLARELRNRLSACAPTKTKEDLIYG